MAIRIAPSVRTTRAYGTRTKYVAKLDIAIVVTSLLTMGFSIAHTAAAVASANSYGYDTPGLPVGIFPANFIAPIFAIMLSGLNIYLYAYQSLNPVWVLVYGLGMIAGWTLSIYAWFTMNWSWQNSPSQYSSNISWGIIAPKLVFGFTAASVTFVQTVMACIAIHHCRPRSSQSEAGVITPPNYDELNAQTSPVSRAPPSFRTFATDKKSNATDTCFCSNCGHDSVVKGESRSSFADEARRSAYGG